MSATTCIVITFTSVRRKRERSSLDDVARGFIGPVARIGYRTAPAPFLRLGAGVSTSATIFDCQAS